MVQLVRKCQPSFFELKSNEIKKGENAVKNKCGLLKKNAVKNSDRKKKD